MGQRDRIAGIVYRHRIVPRVVLGFHLWLTYDVWEWYRAIPDPNTAQMGFASSVLLALVGFSKFYLENSPWEPPDQIPHSDTSSD